MENTYKKILLKQRPVGFVRDEDLDVVTLPVPTLADGEALVRIELIAMEPVTRVMMTHDIGIAPPIAIGAPITGFAAGVVVRSRTPELPVGQRVTGAMQWSQMQVFRNGDIKPLPYCDMPLDVAFHHYGHTAVAAYFGMLVVGGAKAGETVVVSGAAGAVGSIAAQLAKLKGCRVVGIAGGPEKCAWLVDELGLDASIDRTAGKVSEELSKLCPGGVDIFFDVVGGDLKTVVTKHLAPGGRLVVSGESSIYLNEGPQHTKVATTNLPEQNATQIVYHTRDYRPAFPEAVEDMIAWKRQGKLKLSSTTLNGFESIAEGLNSLFNGKSRGRVFVDPWRSAL